MAMDLLWLSCFHIFQRHWQRIHKVGYWIFLVCIWPKHPNSHSPKMCKHTKDHCNHGREIPDLSGCFWEFPWCRRTCILKCIWGMTPRVYFHICLRNDRTYSSGSYRNHPTTYPLTNENPLTRLGNSDVSRTRIQHRSSYRETNRSILLCFGHRALPPQSLCHLTTNSRWIPNFQTHPSYYSDWNVEQLVGKIDNRFP